MKRKDLSINSFLEKNEEMLKLVKTMTKRELVILAGELEISTEGTKSELFKRIIEYDNKPKPVKGVQV